MHIKITSITLIEFITITPYNHISSILDFDINSIKGVALDYSEHALVKHLPAGNIIILHLVNGKVRKKLEFYPKTLWQDSRKAEW